MSKEHVPSLNFPFTSSLRLQHSICDYGRTGQCGIFKDDQGRVKCFPQKETVPQSGSAVRLHSENPSLPINRPNEVCKRFSLAKHLHQTSGDDMVINYTQRNVKNFASDHGDIFYQGLSTSVANSVKYYEKQQLKKFTSKTSTIAKIFGDDFCDIPVETLKELLTESLAEDMVQSRGGYYGNCLANQTSLSDITSLYYPGGCNMDQLMSTSIKFSSDDGDAVVRLNHEHKVFSFPGKICEISTSNESVRNQLVAVRTDYACSFFKWEDRKDSLVEQEPEVNFLGSMACKTKPCSVLVSPYIAGEVAIAMETGSIHLWNEGGDSVQVVKNCSASTPAEFDWYFCEFGFHPRQIICGNKTCVELLDLRTRMSTAKELLNLPSPHLFTTDQFSAVQRHPDNANYVFVGTNQLLLMMDRRFEQNPVMKMSHSLLGPIKYINVVQDMLLCGGDVLVFVGEYKNHEVHCYQYSHGAEVPRGVQIDDAMRGLAPHLTANQWKVSPYNDWPAMVHLPDKAVTLPAIKEKLSAPLLGLSAIPFKNNLAILQLSQEGDLFYQSFKPKVEELIEERTGVHVLYYEEVDNDHTASGGCGKQKPVLSEWDRTFTNNWSEILQHISNKENLADLEGTDFCYVDTEVPRSLWNLDHDTACLLCNCSSSENDIVENQEPCFYCGLNRAVSDKLAASVGTGLAPVVLTNGYLGISHEIEELKLFDESLEYCDPLGKVLLKNWCSEEQSPIELDSEIVPPQSGDEIIQLDTSATMKEDSNTETMEQPEQIQRKFLKSTQNKTDCNEMDDVVNVRRQTSSVKKKQKLSRVAGF